MTDANGNTVFTGAGETGSGNHAFNWNGKDLNGNDMPDGAYTLSVNAQNNGATVNSAISSSGQVSEVDITSGTPQLLIGAMSVPLSSIAKVQN